jgi:hypothetical protein
LFSRALSPRPACHRICACRGGGRS